MYVIKRQLSDSTGGCYFIDWLWKDTLNREKVEKGTVRECPTRQS